MKKLLAAVAALSLSLCLSVSTLAAVPSVVLDQFVYEEGGNTHVGVIPYSLLSEEIKPYWVELMSSGQVIVARMGTGNFYFINAPVGSVLSVSGVSIKIQRPKATPKFFQFYVAIIPASGEKYLKPNTPYVTLSDKVDTELFNSGLLFLSIPEGVDYSALPAKNNLTSSITGDFYVHDDNETEPPVTSSTPDPPSSSAPPYVPALPPVVGGGTSEYIPYDTNIWWDIVAYMRTAAGSTGDIILPILGLLLIIPLIKSLIKHYASAGKGAGGGDVI